MTDSSTPLPPMSPARHQVGGRHLGRRRRTTGIESRGGVPHTLRNTPSGRVPVEKASRRPFPSLLITMPRKRTGWRHQPQRRLRRELLELILLQPPPHGSHHQHVGFVDDVRIHDRAPWTLFRAVSSIVAGQMGKQRAPTDTSGQWRVRTWTNGHRVIHRFLWEKWAIGHEITGLEAAPPTRRRFGRFDLIGPVDAGKLAPTGCEELLYPVKEPARFRSSNIGEPTMNQLDGGGTRRRRTASAVSRRLQW